MDLRSSRTSTSIHWIACRSLRPVWPKVTVLHVVDGHFQAPAQETSGQRSPGQPILMARKCCPSVEPPRPHRGTAPAGTRTSS